MAQVWIDRAYIEPHDDDIDQYAVEIYINSDKKEILAGKVEMRPRSWVYLEYNEDKDLIINNSPGMEKIKWDLLIYETLGHIDE
jgi:hypothetical protein